MKIIVYGAGVIGTLYAAKLQEGGHRVTVLARGERLVDIRRYFGASGHCEWRPIDMRVDTTERLDPDDQYDIALISVRRDNLQA